MPRFVNGIEQLFVALLACVIFASQVAAREKSMTGKTNTVPVIPLSGDWNIREGLYYKRNWGIEIIGVKVVSSGWMLRLNYRVLDPDKAAPLFDKKNRPYLVDERSGVALAVPNLENVGELRQTVTPEAGRTYFTVFGNPGNLVKAGNPVDVVFGNLHINHVVVN